MSPRKIQSDLEVYFNECYPRCVGKLDRWEGSKKHNSYDI